MRLSVIIVNYNVKYFLEQCLLSLRRAIRDIEAEVFVVDNNSIDGSVAMVKDKFPEVKLIANTDNPGFSVANNQAIRQARGEYVLLLNPDTVLAEDSLHQCLRFMDDHPDGGGLGLRMLDGSGAFLPESKRGFPSPWVAFCKAFGLSRVFPKSKWFNHYHLGYLDEMSTHQVEVLAGAFMFLRAKSLEEIGWLDEQFFMYGEDIDLSYRLIKGGYQNYYLPSASIIHYKGESTKKGSLNYVRVFYQAMILFARKHFQGAGAQFFVGVLKLAVYFRASLSLLSSLFDRIYLPLFDSILLFVGLVFFKNFWANYHFQDPNYYSTLVDQINFPLYIFIWLISIFFSGGYDRPTHIRRLIRGILIGALVLAAVYGFLPMYLRSSRALIILGTAWALFSLPVLRLIIQVLLRQDFSFGPEIPRNLAIVGSTDETERALRYLDTADVRKNYLGRFTEKEEDDPLQSLGNIHQLQERVRLYRIDELLFCSRDLSYQQIIKWMDRLGPKLLYKILPEASTGIIGSQSKNTTGQLYTLEVKYKLNQPAQARNKRMLDVLLACFVLLTWPILLWWQKRPLQYFKNGLWVLFGLRTWVGYRSIPPVAKLPKLRKGILNPADLSPDTDVDQATTNRLDKWYARDYRLQHDWEIIWQSWKNLGR